MNTRFCAAAAALLALGAAAASFGCQGPDAYGPSSPDAGPAAEHHGFAGCAIDSSTGVPLRYANGATVPNAVVHLIYWLPTPSDHFVANDSPSDAVYEGLVQQFVGDVDSVSVFGVVKEYLGPNASVALGGTLVYARPYPKAGSASAPLQDSDIQVAVADVLDHFGTGWKAGPSDIFVVFTAANVQSCDGNSCTAAADIDGGQAIRAWHGKFSHGGATVVYANIPSAASIGVPRGGPNDPDIEPTIQMLSHELFESMTDPSGAGWSSWNDSKNPSGGDCGEMGDHCPLGVPLEADGSDVMLANGHEYLLPSMWSNAAGQCTLDLPTGVRSVEEHHRHRLLPAHDVPGRHVRPADGRLRQPLLCGGCSTGQTCQNNVCQSPPTCHTAITCCIQAGGEWIRGKCQLL